MKIKVDRIWLQGDEALVPILPLPSDRVRYRIPGIGETVELCDYREVGRQALEMARTAEGARQFHRNFDTSALVKISETPSGTVISLHDSQDVPESEYDVLWIAACVTDQLPPHWPMAWRLEKRISDEVNSFIAILE
jgi:hypothetical protein